MAPAAEVRELSVYPPTRSRAASTMPPPSQPKAQTPLFRSETPASVIDPDEDIDAFRARSQSVARAFDIDDELEDEDQFQSRRSASLISRLGDVRDVEKPPTDLSIEQYLSPVP